MDAVFALQTLIQMQTKCLKLLNIYILKEWTQKLPELHECFGPFDTS